MKLSDMFKRRTKGTQFKFRESYSTLKYSSGDNSTSEIVWNGTNLEAPEYILNKEGTYKLFFERVLERVPHKKSFNPGERYLVYKSPESYILERTPMLRFYWDQNFNNCQKSYSSYEQYFTISCKNMNKPRLELITYEV